MRPDAVLGEEAVLGETEPVEQREEAPSVRMSLKEAIVAANNLAGEILEDVGAPFTADAIEAAAVLHLESPEHYQRLKEEVVASNADTNEWKKLVKAKVVELKVQNRRRGDTRPVIEDVPELHLMVDHACDALSGLGGVYERGGELVEIIDGLDDPEIYPIPKGRIRELLSRAARWEKWTQDGPKAMKPPTSVVDSVHARASWGLPQLKGFVDGACMIEDGTILSTEGYHPDYGIFVRRSSDISGLKNPTQEDAIRAREHLLGLLVDFELISEEREAHESAWLASLLSILARPAIEGCTPLFLYDANRPRVGKTRLAELVCLIATGRSPTPQAAPAGRDADSEMQKTITGIARSGTPIVFFDNVKGKLGGPSLELAITARRWSARILGESRTYEGQLMLNWLATSNNAQLTPDMHGRTLLIRIKSDHESPEKRTGFQHPSIMRHVRQYRSDYLRSALTILRAWHVAGRPHYGFTPWGSFEEWGEIVRNAVMFAGGVDPCQTREGLIEADSETRAARAVLASWPEGVGLTSSQISRGMREGHIDYGHMMRTEELVSALGELLSSSSPRGIGYQLGNWKDRIIDGRVLVREKDQGKNVFVWRVKKIGGKK